MNEFWFLTACVPIVLGTPLLEASLARKSDSSNGSEPGRAALRIWESKASLLPKQEGTHIALSVSIGSDLDVPVREIELGMLVAPNSELFSQQDWGSLYVLPEAIKGFLVGDVGIVRRSRNVRISPGERVLLPIEIEIEQSWPRPKVFVVHVLGYRLETISFPLLLRLLRSKAAADEVAVVRSFALSGTNAEKVEVRRRFGHDKELISGLVAHLGRVLGEGTLQEVIESVFVVRALGVLGGSGAMHALKRFHAKGDMSRLDQGLLVLRAARYTAPSLQAAMAYVVPPDAKGMRDVVQIALDDLKKINSEGVELGSDQDFVEKTGAGVSSNPEDLPKASQTGEWMLVVVGSFLFVGGIFLFWRRFGRTIRAK